MSRILLDTRCWLWLLAEPERFPASVCGELQDASTELLLSVASIRELMIKHARGLVDLGGDPQDAIPELMRKSNVHSLPITMEHVFRAERLPSSYGDVFDRLIIAQSEVERIPLLTADDRFFGEVPQ